MGLRLRNDTAGHSREAPPLTTSVHLSTVAESKATNVAWRGVAGGGEEDDAVQNKRVLYGSLG